MFSLRNRLRRIVTSQPKPKRRTTRRLRRIEPLEDRRLLTANLNLTPSGLLIYGGSDVNNDLDISFDGANYTFSDPAEPINPIGAIVDLNPDPNIVTFAPPAISRIIINPNQGDDTTTVTGFRPGNEGFDVRDDEGEGNDTVNILGDIGSAGMPVTGTVIVRGEIIDLNASIFTANQKVTIANDVVLTSDETVDAGTGVVEFVGDIDGAFALDIAGAGAAFIGGDVGAVAPPTSLSLSATGLVDMAGSVTTTGATTLTSTREIQLGDDVLAGTGGAGSLTLDAPVVELTNPIVYNIESSGAAADAVTITGSVIETECDDVIIIAGAGDVTIGGNVAGVGALTVTGDEVAVDGQVSAMGEVMLTGATSVASGGLATTGGNVTVVGPLTLGGVGTALVSASGNISLPATTLTSNVTFLVSPGGNLDVGNVTGGGSNVLVRGAGGALGSAVFGNVTGAGRFRIDSSGANTAVLVDLLDVDATDVVVRAGSIITGGTISASVGNLHLAGAVTMAGNTTLSNTSGNPIRYIRVDGTIDGAFDLVVDSGVGTTFFGGTVGGVTRLNSMAVNSGGINYLVVAINVTNGFSWTVGIAGNGVNDRIIRAGAGAIDSINGPITLEADKLQGFASGVNVIGPGQTLTERGAGD